MSEENVPNGGGPLNLSEDEVEYLWETMKREIGSEEVWESDNTDEACSVHAKVHRLYYSKDKFDIPRRNEQQ